MNPPFQNANWEEYIQGSLTYRTVSGEAVADDSTLPPGVAAQLIYDAAGSTVDRYVRTGLIVFDPQGRLAGGRDFFVNQDSNLGRTLDSRFGLKNGSGKCISSFGVVLYDRTTFTSKTTDAGQPFTENDWTLTTLPNLGDASIQADEVEEELWLDENTTPLLINRFSGALMSGGQ